MMMWWWKGRGECGEWEWSNQERINHWFTGRWHFLKTLIIIPSCHCCQPHTSTCRQPCLIRGTHEFTHQTPSCLARRYFSSGRVFYAWWGFEGRQVAPSPIHRNARNAQHLNAPPPKLVYHHHHHSPILYPPTQSLATPHPLTSIPRRAHTGAKPTWNIDLICVQIGATLSAQSFLL